MFKTPVVLCAGPFFCLHLITACSTINPTWLDAAAESSRRAIAQALVAASSSQWRSSPNPIYVHVTTGQSWLRNALIDELTANEFLLVDDPLLGHELSVSATKLSANALHVLLTMDDNQTVERVFQFETTARRKAPSIRADSGDMGIHVSPTAKVRTPQRIEPTTTPLDFAARVRTSKHEASPRVQVANAAESSISAQCTDIALRQGSLKQSLSQIMQGCDWRLASWPVDPKKPGHELDWLVPRTHNQAFNSLEELVHALRITFDLEIAFNDATKSVRVQLRD